MEIKIFFSMDLFHFFLPFLVILISMFTIYTLLKSVYIPGILFKNVLRRIKVLSKKRDEIVVNKIFKDGFRLMRKNLNYINKIYLIVLFLQIFSAIGLGYWSYINWTYFDLHAFLLCIIPFPSLVFFFYVYTPKKMIKNAEKRLEKWTFVDDSYCFDKEYIPNETPPNTYLFFQFIQLVPFVFSYKVYNKRFKYKDWSIYYMMIWGIHLPEVDNIEEKKINIYQEFINLIHKEGRKKQD
ncbi:hypothetical protein [Mycoplasmopsis canis]|uniref:hypothetical protein n=1 Tax=Mycoplasmopsis canis TaxID=29555 RepID=UPI00025AFF06|nr:hypothetical protein [Mycoplasmopsis canis]EIE39280.1 hypothetical protein MCANUF33_02725 [Mycoplasmopsis canis UF33]